MIKRITCRLAFMLPFLIALHHSAIAQFEEGKETIILNPIAGAAIIAGVSDSVSYAKATGEVSKKIKNIISLQINEHSSTFFKSGFKVVVFLKIESWAVCNPLSTTVQTQYRSLTVNYSDVVGAKYDVRAYILLEPAERVKITVDNIAITGNIGWDPKPLLILENQMRVTRYYDLSNDAAVLTPSFNAPLDQTDAVAVSWIWNDATNNNLTQLEWAWLPAELPAGYYASHEQLFQNNSTRVDLDPGQNNYNIPLLYGDTARLFYRARAALRKNNGSLITGLWSSPEVFPLSGFFNGHQDSVNWQSSTSFAENGRFKTVIQYFDGSLRSRQTVTKDNSTGNTIVAETMYDLQGRPNLQILPTPTIDGIIKYHRDFNRFDIPGQINSPSNTENPARYFDLSVTALKCSAAPKLDTAFGNGRYYSANNPWLTAEEKSKYIPNADGYAFAETRYMDDATGRVSRQGGVGKTFQINNGHDTRYFYGKPSQPELDALFGTEAGDATHYSKNMVQDANGQMSVNYTDMHGRTVATALAGDSTANLDAIYTNAAWYPSNKNISITSQLLSPAANIITGNSIESVSTILVPATRIDTFTYKLDPPTLTLLNANNELVCFDCKYDLEISIRPEDCSDIAPIIRKYANLQITPCGSSMGFTGPDIPTPVKEISFTETLSAGSWVVRKTLTINDSVFLVRKDSALKTFLRFTEQHIYDSVYSLLAAGCASPGFATTLPCDSCTASLGSFPMYKSRYLQAIDTTVPEADIHLQYSLDSLACAGACGALNVSLSSLHSLRNQLLNDMVPYTGQYAIDKDSIAYDLTRAEARYNIFTTNGFRQPKNEEGQESDYFTEDAHIDLTIDRSILKTISAHDYVNLFQRSWAKSLLYYHPEFSKLKFAETNLAASYSWLDKVEACESYAEALNKGYLTPLSADPYFVNNYVPGDKLIMQQYLVSNLGAVAESQKFSIWQIANGNVSCALKPDFEKENCIALAKKDGIDPGLDADSVWEQFKAIYLSYRNEMVVNYINAQGSVLSRAGMDSLQQENKQLNFANAKDIAGQNGWTWWALASASHVDTAALRAAASIYLTQVTSSDKCAGQKPFWKARLLQCEELQNRLDKYTGSDSTVVTNIINIILDSLVMVCRNSASAQAPYGYSTVNPAYAGTPKSFEAIINNVFMQNGIATLADSNYFCNPYSIDFPKPFGKNPPLTVNYTNLIDSCGCSRFAALKLEAGSFGFDTFNLSGVKGMNQFLILNYKDSLSTTLWQGLQKCTAGFSTDSCYTVIIMGGYPYDHTNQMPAAKQELKMVVPGDGRPKPPLCPVPVIDGVIYVNTTTSINNIRINYSTSSTYTFCSLSIFDSLGRYINNIAIPCGIDQSITISLPECQKYTFSIYAEGRGCEAGSSVATLTAACAACPEAAVISGVYYRNTGSVNNVQLNYTSSLASANCRVVVTNVNTGVKFIQPVTGGSSSVVLSLPACQGYRFQVFSGFSGSCYDSSNVFILPGCTRICKRIYAPIILQGYVAMPSFLACNYQKPCISCNTLNALVAEFKTIYPAYAVPHTDSADLTHKQLKQNSLLARFLNYRTGFSKNAHEYLAAIKGCSAGGDVFALCSFSKPLNDISGIFTADTVPCRSAQTQAAFMAQLIFRQLKDSLTANFDSLYKAKCLSARYMEQFYVSYQPKEYHYTLYYYDQAGNLVKTMPPAAVKPNYDLSYLAQVKAARMAATDYANPGNNELLSTHYRYNSLNQVVAQKTPDAGISRFWYDRLGRLVISQNAQQASPASEAYSYTLYDVLGRITEVGQKPQSTAMSQVISQDTMLLKNWLNGAGVKEQITVTKYDEVYTPLAVSTATSSGLWQKNLRNRVSYTAVKALDGIDPGYPWDAATFYSYDIHGNVDTLLQDYKTGLGAVYCARDTTGGNRFKKMVYAYDLISGKVNDVAYQPGQADQFYHHYNYDAENRLTEVRSSKDKVYWEKEASYDYYRHGPLARTVLGENQVQGLDYAYTLQGWLKGVNSTAVLSTSAGTSFDIGRDGIAVASNNNSLVARDAYGFSLNYFSGDYLSINNSVMPFAGLPLSLPVDINGAATGRQLFNGNIAAMAVNIPVLGNGIVYGYSYDQLNRIVRMNAFDGLANAGNSFTPVRTNKYHEQITYDPNGNIQTYLRNGDSRSPAMDNLAYHYVTGTNQLHQVTDAVITPTPADYNDIKTQSPGNYRYDKIGNLISDISEGISNIAWTVYSKINTIAKTNGSVIKYTYDASGNRNSKIVTTATTGDSTYYVRDASGNVMSVYNKKGALALTQTELHLYGSSRLGVYNVNVDVENCLNTTNPITTFTRGNKFFELSNHLGNVLATISDKKLQVSLDGIFVGYYMPDVVMAGDYYPGGMQMPGRKQFQGANKYPYGFNGKENDNEIKGEGNQQDYGLRIYDPRLVRFLSVDPLSSSYPWYTPYQFAGNSPIANIDLDGGEPKPSTSGTQEGQTTTTSEEKYIYSGMGYGTNYTATQTWNWHAGGLNTGKFQKNANGKGGAEVLTQSGWYTSKGYVDVLKSSLASGALATDLHLLNGAANLNGSLAELLKFVGTGLNENAEKHLIAGAQSKANVANFAVTGTTYSSAFNVEDLLGVGLLFKEGLKLLGSYAAKNLASRSINLIREGLSIGGGRNIGTLGGIVEGAGYHTIGISGVASRAGTVGAPVLRRFTTLEVGGYDRLFDSEVKLLEKFAEKFHNTPNVGGVLTLTSERQFCTSCSGVVEQFKKAFPNVQLNVINGVK